MIATDYIFGSLPAGVKIPNFTAESTEVESTALNTYSGPYRALDINNAGTRLYATTRSPEAVRQYQLTTPGDLNTIVELPGALTGLLSDPRGIRIKNNGTKFYYGRAGIREYNLETPGDIETAVNTGRYLAPPTGTGLSGFDISDDGTKAFFAELNGRVIEYTLTTPWQITPATANPKELLITTDDGSPPLVDELILFNGGNNLMIIDRQSVNGNIWIYYLETPNNLDSRVLQQKIKTIGSTLFNNSIVCAGIAEDVKKLYFNQIRQVGYTL